MRFVSLILLICSLVFANSLLAADDEEEEAPKLKPVYHSLAPSLVSNLQEHKKYIRCDVQLMTKGDENIAKIQSHEAALRHEMLLLMGDQKSSELKTPKGKEKLRKAALKSLQKILEELEGEKEIIKDLYFTSFFVQ
ncbi:MAG: flagellar basal body-associated FliL family protein [Sedimenticola sp.]